MRRLLPALLCCALVTCLTALAHAHTGHGVGEQPQVANLDGDPEPERVLTRNLCQASDGTLTPPQGKLCPTGVWPRHRIELEDTCAGTPRVLALSGIQDLVLRLRVTEVDGDASRQEVFLDARSGATNRQGAARVVRMQDSSDGRCPSVETLFLYPSRASRGALPRGAAARVGWDVEVRDYTPRYRGREVRVLETYKDRNDADCCPTFIRSTFFRLASTKDRYVRFRTSVMRIKG